MTAYLGFRNLIPEATLSGTGTAPGFERENAIDWFTYTWWRGNSAVRNDFIMDFDEPVTVDYFGMAAHNIDTIPGEPYFYLSYYDFDAESWIKVGYDYAPLSNIPNMQLITPLTQARWRFRVENPLGTEAPYIGVLSLGEVMELPEGIRPPFTPPPAAVNDEIYNMESATGQFLGRSVEKFGYKIDIVQNQLDPEFIRENWYEIAQMLSTQPFFYSWNYEEYPDDAVYAWLDDKMPIPRYVNPLQMEFIIKARALHLIRWF